MKKTEAISCTEMISTVVECSRPTVEIDPFYGKENQQLLAQRIAEYNASPEKFKEHELIEVV